MATNAVASAANGFTAEERAAMKQRAAEMRAEGRNGAKKADALQALLDRIAEIPPQDRALAERVHAGPRLRSLVTPREKSMAPALLPRPRLLPNT